MMLTRHRPLSLLLAALASSTAMDARQPPAPYREPAVVEGARDVFVNRVWVVVASSGVAPGALYTFLSDGTLVITSPTGRDAPGVGRWSRTATGLVLVEEGRSYPTEILEASAERFRIRVSNPGTPTDITFAPAPHRMDDPGDPRPGDITPVPTSYRCGGQTYRIAVEEGAAYVTLPDGGQVTLRRLTPAPADDQPRTFTNGRLTITHDARTTPPTVTVARGRMVPLACRAFPTTPP